jgi:hypothetical protein
MEADPEYWVKEVSWRRRLGPWRCCLFHGRVRERWQDGRDCLMLFFIALRNPRTRTAGHDLAHKAEFVSLRSGLTGIQYEYRTS